jgi:hypothetical protein
MAAATVGKTDAGFTQMSSGAFQWWRETSNSAPPESSISKPVDWRSPHPSDTLESVDLTHMFNDRVSAIFAPGKYLLPRSPGVSLELPSQGVGAWAGHLTILPRIDDTGLRKVAADHGGKLAMPNGIFFSTPFAEGSNNIVFTSQWDNYPREATVPLAGHAAHAYFLMAGSTNFMQSRMENGEVLVNYTDGTSASLPLRNPETWWPIEQDYFIDDYQFPLVRPLPPRVDLETGKIRLLSLPAFKGQGREVHGGAATVLDLKLDPAKTLKSLTVRAIANDVVIGLMSATLERPRQ